MHRDIHIYFSVEIRFLYNFQIFAKDNLRNDLDRTSFEWAVMNAQGKVLNANIDYLVTKTLSLFYIMEVII